MVRVRRLCRGGARIGLSQRSLVAGLARRGEVEGARELLCKATFDGRATLPCDLSVYDTRDVRGQERMGGNGCGGHGRGTVLLLLLLSLLLS